jgi:hypothetical protein
MSLDETVKRIHSIANEAQLDLQASAYIQLADVYKLLNAITDMRETLIGAAAQFAKYESYHLAKPTPDIKKVETNTIWKTACTKAADLDPKCK